MEKGRIMAYIKVENLKYRYPNTTKLALDGLDFEIEKGSFVGVIGENGAGKSTLCQAFNGLVPGFFKGAYGGKVLIEDTEVAKTTVSKLCQKVGLVFQITGTEIRLICPVVRCRGWRWQVSLR